MKKLTLLPSIPTNMDYYENIRTSKHSPVKDVLFGMHADISAQYENYERAIAANNIDTLSACVRCGSIADHLCSCYKCSTKALVTLKKAIKSAQIDGRLKYCPMCGTTIPLTFDHYLPSSIFPEFSVFAPNLVPCCGICNSKKNADWLNNGRRQYLYAYIDDIPDQYFLVITLRAAQNPHRVGAFFELVRPIGLDDSMWALLASHFTKLGLIDRFNELANDEIAEIISSCKSHLDAGGMDSREFLKCQANKLSNVHGQNFWIAVLMKALAWYPEFERLL